MSCVVHAVTSRRPQLSATVLLERPCSGVRTRSGPLLRREGEEPERRNTLAQSRPAVAYPVNRYRLRFSRMRARTAGSGGGAVNRSPVTLS